MSNLEILAQLAAIIASRKNASPESSYTAQLLSGDTAEVARKFGEESLELILAATEGDKTHITAEAADMLYHMLVLLEKSGVRLDDVMKELERREGTSGITEKQNRKG